MNQKRTKDIILKLYNNRIEARNAFEEELAAICFDEENPEDYIKVQRMNLQIHYPTVIVWYTTPDKPEKFLGLSNVVGLECINLEKISGTLVNTLTNRLIRTLKFKCLEQRAKDLKKSNNPW